MQVQLDLSQTYSSQKAFKIKKQYFPTHPGQLVFSDHTPISKYFFSLFINTLVFHLRNQPMLAVRNYLHQHSIILYHPS